MGLKELAVQSGVNFRSLQDKEVEFPKKISLKKQMNPLFKGVWRNLFFSIIHPCSCCQLPFSTRYPWPGTGCHW